MLLIEKKTRHERQILTAQDSHVEPGVDVGQLILQKQKVLFFWVHGCVRANLNEISPWAPTLMPELLWTQTYIKHGRISAELHQVLAQFTLVLIQHIWKKTHTHTHILKTDGWENVLKSRDMKPSPLMNTNEFPLQTSQKKDSSVKRWDSICVFDNSPQ